MISRYYTKSKNLAKIYLTLSKLIKGILQVFYTQMCDDDFKSAIDSKFINKSLLVSLYTEVEFRKDFISLINSSIINFKDVNMIDKVVIIGEVVFWKRLT